MKLTTWIKYFFKDNARFWVCFRFFINASIVKLLNTRIGNKLLKAMPQSVIDWYVMTQFKVLDDTLKFKMDRGDSA